MKLTIQDFAEIVAALRRPGTNAAAQEKRRAVRMTVNAKLDAALIDGDELGRAFSTLTRDVSLTGAGLFQSLPLQQGQEFVLILPKQSGKPICIRTVVMHCRPLADALYGIGCEFVAEAPPEVAKQLLSREADQERRIRDSVLH
jgi:hypothetical protein